MGPSPACTAIAPGGALGASTDVALTVIADGLADTAAADADDAGVLMTEAGMFEGAAPPHPMDPTATKIVAEARPTRDIIAARVYLMVVRRPRDVTGPRRPQATVQYTAA